MIRYVCVLSLLLTLLVVLGGCEGESAEELRAAGKEAFFEEDYSRARDLLVQALQLSPSDKDLLYYAGLAYERDFLYDSAIFYFRRADILYPKDRAINQHIRVIATGLGRWQEAIDATYVLARSGDGYEAYNAELSRLWEENGSSLNALYWGRKAIASDTLKENWYIRLSGLASKCGSLYVSIAYIDSAIDLIGPRNELVSNKATCLADLGDYIAAETLLRPLVDSDSALDVSRYSLARTLAAQNDRNKKIEAIQLFRELLPLLPPEAQLDSIIAILEEELQ
ncbi:MAG: hypothetical protein DRP45_05480 [Candidatus Zixiibacteriota bacterium]|nr:MAG: hypothetical protein DRP45_05480 [candidate division Zixibacteria bacterium]